MRTALIIFGWFLIAIICALLVGIYNATHKD